MKDLLSMFKTWVLKNWPWVLAFLTSFAFVFYGWIWTYNWQIITTPSQPDADRLSSFRGTFGDKFGAVNALFSGLSLIGITIAIALQHQELRATKEALEAEINDRDHQKFEATLFKLIDLINQPENNIIFQERDSTGKFGSKIQGKEALDKILINLKNKTDRIKINI